MDLQQKFDIAVKLLERNIGMRKIIFCPTDELSRIASDLFINRNDLATFAEEVCNRTFARATREVLQREQKAGTVILVTDDPACITKKMLGQAMDCISLERIAATYLEAGYHVAFRIRNQEIAERFHQFTGHDVKKTEEPLPSLRDGDMVLEVSGLQDERAPIVTRWLYKSDDAKI